MMTVSVVDGADRAGSSARSTNLLDDAILRGVASTEMHGQEAGFDAYLIKPVDPQKIEEALSAAAACA